MKIPFVPKAPIPKGNVFEIDKIVQEMTKDYKSAPNYNQAAADIVRQGSADKIAARNGYQTQLTPPLAKYTPPVADKKTL